MLGATMRKIFTLIVTVPCLAFAIHAKAGAIAEDLSAPNGKILVDFLGTKQFYAATKSKMVAIKAATVASNFVTAHSSPVVVMPTINTTAIFWGTSWAATNTTFISDKVAGLTYFYSYLGSSTYTGTVSEYFGSGLPLSHTLAAVKTDASRKSSSAPAAVLTEVCNLIGAKNIDPNGYYPVYSDLPRGTASYCAYHSAGQCTAGGTTVQFAFFFNLNNDSSCDPQSPYAPASGSASAQAPLFVTGGGIAPQTQSQGLAALINVTAHELAETATDPVYFPRTGSAYWAGYFDVAGNEVGDKCAWTFGPSNIAGTKPGTVLVGAYDWKLQGEWSNKAYSSSTGYDSLKGCVTGS